MMQSDEMGFGAGAQKRVLKATAEGLMEATGTVELTLQGHLMREVLDALWIPYGLPEDEQSKQLDAVYALMREIVPRDAMEGLCRAMQHDQTDEVRNDALRLAVKLLALYPCQMEALDRRRGHSALGEATAEPATGTAAG